MGVLRTHLSPSQHAAYAATSGPHRPGGCAVHTIDLEQRSNKLLASLPHEDLQLLIPHLSSVQLASGTVLAEPGVEVDHVYFPLSGAVSLLVVMRDGKTIETGTVGREGVVGAMSGIGSCKWQVRAIAKLPMFARKIASTEFRKAVSSSRAIADLCIGCNEGLLTQARIGAACNAVHQIEARFCRWLLETRDRAESNTIMLRTNFSPRCSAFAARRSRRRPIKYRRLVQSVVRVASSRSSISKRSRPWLANAMRPSGSRRL